MNLLFSFLLVLCAANVVLSSTLYMNYPEANSAYRIGDTMLIEWYTKETGISSSLGQDKYVTIVLAYGQRNNLTIDRIMTTRSTMNLGFYQWIIPATVQPRSDYVIEVGTDTSNIAFAGYIIISQRNMTEDAPITVASPKTVTHKALDLN